MNKLKKMDILFVSQYFYPETFKGNDIVFELVNRGHNVTVLTAKPNYPNGEYYNGYTFFGKREEYINGAKVIRCPIYPRKNGKGINLILNYISFVFFSYFTSIFSVKGKFDVILVQQLSPVTVGLPGIWLKKRKKAKLFLWVLDLWPESFVALSNIKNKILINIIHKLVKYIYAYTDEFLVSSKSFIKSIQENSNTDKPIYYLPNWADENQDNSIDLSKLPEFPDGFNILFAGNIGYSQGLDNILKAAKLTKDINWIFLGDGRYMPELKAQIEKDSLKNVYTFGRFPIETMSYFYNNADIMLVSLADDPVFSLTVPAKIQSYMYYGKIILGMLNGEGNDLINNLQIGAAVKSGDWINLVDRAYYLKSLVKSQKVEMEKRSKKEYLDNFSKKKNIDKLEQILLSKI